MKEIQVAEFISVTAIPRDPDVPRARMLVNTSIIDIAREGMDEEGAFLDLATDMDGQERGIHCVESFDMVAGMLSAASVPLERLKAELREILSEAH